MTDWALTPEQIETLYQDMHSIPELTNAWTTGDDVAIANYYNVMVSPEYIVWKRRVGLDEIMQNGFDWVQVDNLTVGKARIWEWLFANNEKAINPSKANVRAGVDECWKGTSAMLAVRDAIYAHLKRPASRIEKLFATGTGTTASPSTMGFEGPISYTLASIARGSHDGLN